MNAVTTDDLRAGLPSASSLYRIAACAGSIAAEEGLPDLPKQAFTEEGTRIHGALETGESDDLTPSESDIASRIRGLESAAVEKWMRDHNIETMPARNSEVRLWIRNRHTLERIASAQLDAFYLSGENALVIDAKTGFLQVEKAEANYQIACQAVALWHEHPNLKVIYVGIAAARLTSSLDMAAYDLEALRHAEQEILHVLWRAQQPDAPRNPGSWCSYCKAKAFCAQAASYALVTLQQVAHADKLQVLEAVQRLQPVQLANIFVKSKIAVQIFEAVKDRLKAMPPEALEPLGLKLKPGAEKVNILDPMAVGLVIEAKLGKDEASKCCAYSIPKAADAYARIAGIKKQAARELLEQDMGTAISKSQNQASLAEI